MFAQNSIGGNLDFPNYQYFSFGEIIMIQFHFIALKLYNFDLSIQLYLQEFYFDNYFENNYFLYSITQKISIP